MSDSDSRTAVKAFISYSHDSPAHSERVLSFAQALNRDGIDVEIDQYHQDKLIDWASWCKQQLRPENSDFVAIICSAEYKRRIENEAEPDEGRGVFWEGRLIRQEIYKTKSNQRFVPVLLDDESEDSIPDDVAEWTWFRLRQFGVASNDPGYLNLYRLLTNQPRVTKEQVGIIRLLSPVDPKPETPVNKPRGEGEKIKLEEAKKCKPFTLEVFVANPETGYKFQLFVQRKCSIDNESLWSLVLDLYKKSATGEWEQIIHVSFKAGDDKETQGVKDMAYVGVNTGTAKILTEEVHPAVKAIAGTAQPTPEQKKRLHDVFSKAAISAVEV